MSSMLDIFNTMPCWYVILIVIFSFYYSTRGWVEKTVCLRDLGSKYTAFEKIYIFYIQEFLFKLIITISSFISLFMAIKIFVLVNFNDIDTGPSILLIFLFLWGIIGVSGYLTHLIMIGKLPSIGGN